LKALGKVVNFSLKGTLIIRAEWAPCIGDRIIDRRSRPLGKVIRITGPVSSPYVIVSPSEEARGSLMGLIGSEVFILPRASVAERGPARRGGRGPHGPTGNYDRPFRRSDRGRSGRSVQLIPSEGLWMKQTTSF